MMGFDMDYTLAIYNQPEMDRLSIEATARRLVERGYPEVLLAMPYRTDFPIRGLLVDRKLGNVLKMDRYRYVKKAYHGLHQLSLEQRRSLYHSSRLRVGSQRYHWVDTLYALSEVSVFAAAVEELERRGSSVDYTQLFGDVRECIDEAHRDGSILNEVSSNLPRYIIRDDNLAPTLHKLRSSGKRLFLLTNSRHEYTDQMMTYLIGDAISEYPSWKNYFDVIITASMKPGFFQKGTPFEEVHEDGTTEYATSLDRGRIYKGGSIGDFERLTGYGGDRVLYVGDHIYGDVLRTKKESGWRTALIMQEMVDELHAIEHCADEITRMDRLEELRDMLYDELRERQLQLKEIQRRIDHHDGSSSRHSLSGLEAIRVKLRKKMERIRTRFKSIDSEFNALESRVDRAFHPFWGSLFKSGAEVSIFGDQVEQYACIYTDRVSSFQKYSPMHYFRSPRDRMPHEP